jgi:hypothetical protein
MNQNKLLYIIIVAMLVFVGFELIKFYIIDAEPPFTTVKFNREKESDK